MRSRIARREDHLPLWIVFVVLFGSIFAVGRMSDAQVEHCMTKTNLTEGECLQRINP